MEPIHIKIDFDEAVSSKRDLLMCEMSTLKLVSRIKKYQELREEEITRKSELKNRLRDARLILERIRKNTPKLKSVKKEKKEIEEKVIDIEKKASIELELRNIKERLEKLDLA